MENGAGTARDESSNLPYPYPYPCPYPYQDLILEPS